MTHSETPTPVIELRGLRQNNLRSIDLDLPLGQLIVITGVSGSGKSSLAFDTLYAEGQRRYLETFSPYARQFLDRLDRPAAERIEGIPPAIAIDQNNAVRTSRSTVGTLTELTDHLKLLYARAARLFCHGCGRPVQRDTPESIWEQLASDPRMAEQRVAIAFAVRIPPERTREEIQTLLAQQGYVRILAADTASLEVIQDRLRVVAPQRGRALEALEQALAHGHGQIRVYPLEDRREPGAPARFSAELHCPDCDLAYADPSPNRFSFNSPLGACPTCRGFGRTLAIDWSRVIPDPAKSLLEGAIKPIQSDGYAEIQEDLIAFANRRGIPTDLPWRDLTASDRDWVISGEGDWESGVWYGLARFFAWLEGRSYKLHVRVLLSRYRAYETCATCKGARLIDEALDWRLGDQALAARVLPPTQRARHGRVTMDQSAWQQLPGLSLADLLGLPIEDARRFCDALKLDPALDPLIGEIRARLRYLDEVGVGYLTLDRQSRTLSGGETQRIHLTTALGSTLVNALFVLDEPSIGLHPRDLERVIGILRRLRDQGNSLVVVEHDPQVMQAADQIIELGPGPGEQGGRLLFQGTPAELLATPGSLTGDFLAGRRQIAAARVPRAPAATTPRIRVQGARAHNLKGIDVEIPLQHLVVITGVSGSGKSTLAQKILYPALCQIKGHPEEPPGEHEAITGAEAIADVVLLDQSSIGRTTRSSPATAVGVLAVLRKRFAAVPLARERGYTAATFSFNSGTGRCPTCGGNGFEHLEMQFLADVYLRCPDCDGRRFRAPVLEVKLEAGPDQPPRSIAEVLDLTAHEAHAAFAHDTELTRALEPLIAVGLGYLRLGQPVPTLSGGEAQRLKLASHLAQANRLASRRGQTASGLLFLLDEPTTGLHFADVAVLLGAFQRLLDAGHSLLVIEHHLDLIAAADWLIDLGPEGGAAGGELVCVGTPEEVAARPESQIGRALASHRASRAHAATARTTTEPARAIAEPLVHWANGMGTPRPGEPAIEVIQAREHNLKGLTLSLP
ncbi:MAG: excinuclease ABC subunit A, partial [Sphingobacteriia bacterium]|nr:excinuclease ABC subunit A [Sphingobacteriia bacterium]